MTRPHPRPDDSDEDLYAIQNERRLPPPTATLTSSPLLRQYSIYVDLRLHITICLSCPQAIEFDHVRSHIVHHGFKGVPNRGDLHRELRESGALHENEIEFPTVPIAAIIGLDVKDGFQCLEDGCGHVSASERCKYEHYCDDHPEQHARKKTPNTKTIPIQILYAFKGRQTILRVMSNPSQRMSGGDAYDRIMKQATSSLPSVDSSAYELPSDKSLQSHMLTFTRWGSFLKGKNLKALRELVELPSEEDPLHGLVAGCETYF